MNKEGMTDRTKRLTEAVISITVVGIICICLYPVIVSIIDKSKISTIQTSLTENVQSLKNDVAFLMTNDEINFPVILKYNNSNYTYYEGSNKSNINTSFDGLNLKNGEILLYKDGKTEIKNVTTNECVCNKSKNGEVKCKIL